MDPNYAVTGLLVGILVGMTGMGGGALMTPLLILILGVKPTVAVGSDLAYAGITKIVGAVAHRKQRTVNVKLALRLAAGSAPGSLFGVWVLERFRAQLGEGAETIVVRALGAMLFVTAFVLIFKTHPKVAEWYRQIDLKGRAEPRRLFWATVIGFFLGFLVGVTSVGSGTLFGVVLLGVFGLPAVRMVGTDIFHASILTVVAGLGHVIAGNVDYALVGSLLMGSVPGVMIGSRAAKRLPEKVMRPVLATILLLSAVSMLQRKPEQTSAEKAPSRPKSSARTVSIKNV